MFGVVRETLRKHGDSLRPTRIVARSGWDVSGVAREPARASRDLLCLVLIVVLAQFQFFESGSSRMMSSMVQRFDSTPAAMAGVTPFPRVM